MKKIKFILFLPALFFSVLVLAQGASDLRLQADSLHKNAKVYFKQQDSASLFQNLRQALSKYKNLQDTNAMANVTNDFGYYYYFYGDFEKSIPFYQKAFALDSAQQDTVGMIGRYHNLGGAYEKLGQYIPAVEYSLLALDLAQKINRSKSIAMVSNGIASLYSDQAKYKQAAEFYQKALAAYQSMGDSLGTSYVLNNLGFLYKDLQQYDSAADYYQRALLLKQKVAGERSQAITIANLGELALLQENYSEALPRLLEARQIFQEEKDTYNLIWVGNILTSLYLRQNETALARPLLDSIRFYLSQDLDAREERLNYLNNEYLWHETNEQPAQALVYHKKWAALRDSLFNKEKLQVQQIQSAYQLRQEEQAKKLVQQEAALARAEVRRQTAITIAVSFILGIIIGLGLLLYRQYAKIKRLSRKNELLVKEQHHRVKNNLQVLSSMLRMQARRIKLQSAKEAIQESELRVHAMSLIHHRLYGDSSTRISMKSYLEELIREVIDSFGCNPHLDLQLEDISLDDRQAAPIGLIVNEVLSNACKYAFPDHPSPELKVRLTAEGKRGYQLSLHDNGPGLDHDAIKKNRTFGMELIMLQAEQIYAKAKFTNQQGNLFTLSFSKSYQDE